MLLTTQVAEFLHDHGVGRFVPNGTGGNIFINAMPSQPNEAIAIYATGGPAIDPSNEYVGRAIQILIRTVQNDPRPGEKMAQAVIDLLKGFNSDYLTAGGNYIVDIDVQQDGPNNIGMDDNKRYEFSQNFIIEMIKEGPPVVAPEPTPDPPVEEPTPEPTPDPPIEEPTPDPPIEPDPPVEEPPKEYTAADYSPVNLSLERIDDTRQIFRWELIGPTPDNLRSFLIFANDVLIAEARAEQREEILDIGPGSTVYMAAIADPYAEYYSDAVTAI